MMSDELAISTVEMKGIEVKAQDLWTTFEVIENGEMGKGPAAVETVEISI